MTKEIDVNTDFMSYQTELIEACRITFEVIRVMKIDEVTRNIYCEKLTNIYEKLRKAKNFSQLKDARKGINEVREEFGYYPVMGANEFGKIQELLTSN